MNIVGFQYTLDENVYIKLFHNLNREIMYGRSGNRRFLMALSMMKKKKEAVNDEKNEVTTKFKIETIY